MNALLEIIASRRQFLRGFAGAASTGALTLAGARLTSAQQINTESSPTQGTSHMKSVRSNDGTSIAYQQAGEGQPLILVHGTADDHTIWTPLLPAFGQHFTVYAIDRRGRGESGDVNSTTYSIEREFEDIVAMVDSTDEPANLLGHSYGALCAVEAALRTDNLRKLVLYEPPMLISPGNSPVPPETVETMDQMLAEGDKEGVMLTFAREIAQLPEEMITAFRAMPEWQTSVEMADTIVREVHAVGSYVFEPERFRNLSIPTLLLKGSESPPYMQAATEAVASALPHSRLTVLSSQGHLAMINAPDLFMGEVGKFLTEA
jgi:pimeloyl-ACP methyl ester carboxylesterase